VELLVVTMHSPVTQKRQSARVDRRVLSWNFRGVSSALVPTLCSLVPANLSILYGVTAFFPFRRNFKSLELLHFAFHGYQIFSSSGW